MAEGNEIQKTYAAGYRAEKRIEEKKSIWRPGYSLAERREERQKTGTASAKGKNATQDFVKVSQSLFAV